MKVVCKYCRGAYQGIPLWPEETGEYWGVLVGCAIWSSSEAGIHSPSSPSTLDCHGVRSFPGFFLPSAGEGFQAFGIIWAPGCNHSIQAAGGSSWILLRSRDEPVVIRNQLSPLAVSISPLLSGFSVRLVEDRG